MLGMLNNDTTWFSSETAILRSNYSLLNSSYLTGIW